MAKVPGGDRLAVRFDIACAFAEIREGRRDAGDGITEGADRLDGLFEGLQHLHVGAKIVRRSNARDRFLIQAVDKRR